ncbi:MAG TPA: hypothetical protein VFK04_07415 [Gemmatimonadaceae bacterium]|nr:hypothetical protein [Gemmatimonadaceae bacterium]
MDITGGIVSIGLTVIENGAFDPLVNRLGAGALALAALSLSVGHDTAPLE